MKKLISLFLLFAVPFHDVSAQDSIRVTFSEVQDTIVKQRFIDRHENVFMTKVPTRHMFKISLTFAPNNLFSVENNAVQTTSYGLGYEYKISPAFSAGTDIFFNSGRDGSNNYVGAINGNIYGRWYYDMKNRIEKGVSVNNFTGNYIALFAGKRWGKSESAYQLAMIGIEFGMQRRFLNNGRIEFALAASYQKYLDGHYPVQLSYGVVRASDFAIESRTSMGLAFGDWKRNNQTVLCEVLRCDEFVQQQWTLLWPKIYLSSRFIQGTVGLAYERKLGSSPVSVHTQVITDYLRIASKYGLQARIVSNDVQVWPSLQLRYYLNQKQAVRTGYQASNLSGVYFGPHSDFVFYRSETIFGEGRPKRHLGIGAAAGFQQTLFKKAYVHFSLNTSYNLLSQQPHVKPWLTAIRAGFGLIL
ncbi:hypothetical protein [Dyadobacter sandarakinus]|uniref:DUF4421 domain-containing protein n=1 Tax=Dyadobacter sandarakinus TaxID=2747268 RepID=A0ABX7I604_9BACT|nr:hypothetical protein [Dyadobacter sandarakinus]QRR01304.1 hypothetical protein HWI92_10520 [Dyadobacter sandarakinus]